MRKDFRAADLARFDREILAPASSVVSMLEVYEGARRSDVVGLRHDVDDNAGSLDTAVKIAKWERLHGYRSTYFMLHTAPYWQRPDFPDCLDVIAACGHEIGIHANAIPEALRTGRKPAEILLDAIGQLCEWGHAPRGVAGHGDKMCRNAEGTVVFVNDEIFSECPRPEMGPARRTITRGAASVELEPKPLAYFGLEYETYRLPHGRYLSDSGGRWSLPFRDVQDISLGQLHVLWHPDWWAKAL